MSDAPSNTPCPVHPDRPATQVCPNCGSFACNECMIGDHFGAVCFRCVEQGGETGRNTIPFERRNELGLVEAFVQTVKGIMLEPSNFWRSHAPTTDNGAAILFFLLLLIPILLSALMVQIAATGAQPFLMELQGLDASDLSDMAPMLAANTGFSIVMTLISTPIQTFVLLFIFAAVNHLLLAMVGGARRDLGATWRMTVYSAAPRVLEIIPILGQLVCLPWLVIARVVTYREGHECSTAQAAFAVLAPYFLCLLCCGAVAATLGAVIMQAIQQGGF